MQWTAPAGDKYYSLAHQYIAAQLNIRANATELGISFADALATTESGVQEAYNEATDFFSSTPPDGKLRGKHARSVTMYASTLAGFNEGMTAGWPYCDQITIDAENRFLASR